jgi:hypothetical protein
LCLIIRMSSSSELKEDMISEALMILRSVSWTERLVNKKLLDLDVATDNYSYEQAQRLKEEITMLLQRLDRENKNMDSFMAKYSALIANEKKAMLSNPKPKD